MIGKYNEYKQRIHSAINRIFFYLVEYLHSILIENSKQIILAWYCNMNRIDETFITSNIRVS